MTDIFKKQVTPPIFQVNVSRTYQRLQTRSLVQHLRTVNFDPHIQPLRPSHSFTLTIPKRVRECQKGGANLHIPILWDDGVKWLIRIKLHWTVAFGEVQQGIRQLVLESERETMILLKKSRLAVPEVYGPVFSAYLLVSPAVLTARSQPSRGESHTESAVSDGIEFIVVEYIDGTPCSRPIHKSLGVDPLDRLIHQFAQFQIKLTALTFHSLGSLYPASSYSGSGPHSISGSSHSASARAMVGPSISLRFIKPDLPSFLGPFTTAGERYLANIELMLHKLEGGDVSLGHPALVYLVHLWYREIVTSMSILWEMEEITIRHADDQGDHILSDPEGNLRGVIDWEWSVRTPPHQ